MMGIAIQLVILFGAIVVHEYAHGWVANQCGDPTAKMMGRLTLNPIKHIDPVGTLLVPAILVVLSIIGVPIIPVGWAKPVPVNFMRLRFPKRDMVLVGMAGPAINVIIAIIVSQLLRWVPMSMGVWKILIMVVVINLLLAIFNMLPIPPLDGSRFVMGVLPNPYLRYYARLEPYGIIIVIVLLNLGIFEKVIFPLVKICSHLLGVPIS